MTRIFRVMHQWSSLKIGGCVCRLRLHLPYAGDTLVWVHHPSSWVCMCGFCCRHIDQKDNVTVKRPSRWLTPRRHLLSYPMHAFVCKNILDNVQIVNGHNGHTPVQILRPVATQTDFCRIDSTIYNFIWSNKMNARINLLKGHRKSKACNKSQSDK